MQVRRFLVGVLVLAVLLAIVATPCVARTKVQVSTWWSFETGSPLDALKAAFEAAHPDIEIEYLQIPSSQYYTKVLTMIAGGTSPDVAMLGMDKLGSWVPRGALQELTPYIKEGGYDLNQLFPAVRKAIEFRGGIYALPRDVTTSVVAYNKTLFDQAGVPYPKAGWTRQDFLRMARVLTKAEGGRTTIYGYAFDTFPDGFVDWLYTNGASFINADANRDGLHEPNAIEVLKFLQGMIKEGIAPSGGQTEAFKYASAAFRIQKSAMYVATVGWANSFAKDEKLNWDVAPLPIWAEGMKPATRLWVNFWTLPKGSKHPKEAFKVMAFFAGPEGQRIVGETRMGIPAIRDIAYGKSFLGLPGAPEHRQVYLDVMQHAIPFPLFPESDQYFTVMKRELDQVWTGQRAVEDAVAAIDQETRSLFGK